MDKRTHYTTPRMWVVRMEAHRSLLTGSDFEATKQSYEKEELEWD